MENTKKYWFYLEPYTFIFREEGRFVVYNTLNSAYLHAPNTPFVSDLLASLEKASNGYCLALEEEQVLDSSFNQFALQVKESFSGGLVEAESDMSKPFLFKPMLFLNTNIRKAQEEDLNFLGERILENLNEVSLYFPGPCNGHCSGCQDYFKQMLHCTCLEKNCLSVADYLSLLLDLNTSGVNKVNILGGDLLNSDYFHDVYPTLSGCKFKKSYHLHFSHLTEACKEWLMEENSELIVSVHPCFEKKRVEEWMNQLSSLPVIWQFPVTSDADVQAVDTLDIPSSVQIEIKPLYTGGNLLFFKENVFCSLEDIIAEPVSRRTIFRRQTLNENFFGKLTIVPSGEVYANVNCKPIGVYPQDSLKKLAFEELVHSTAWFRLRDKQPCSGCANKYLCPSVSNYELVMERDNFCLVKE